MFADLLLSVRDDVDYDLGDQELPEAERLQMKKATDKLLRVVWLLRKTTVVDKKK